MPQYYWLKAEVDTEKCDCIDPCERTYLVMASSKEEAVNAWREYVKRQGEGEYDADSFYDIDVEDDVHLVRRWNPEDPVLDVTDE